MPRSIQNCKIVIITSLENHTEIKKFFKEKKFFGGSKNNFIFCQQSMMPSTDLDGKIILKDVSKLQISSNGTGVLFEQLAQNQELRDLFEQVEFVHVCQVDNILNKYLDPYMIGYTKKHNLEGSLKAFTRVNPSDELSVICQTNDKYDILEYDELLNKNLSDKRDANGNLVYNLANMENYILKTKILLKLASNMDDLNKLYQKSFKKIPTYDEEEEKTVEPESANGYKFELAIGKYFQMCDQKKLKILLVEQKDEYACLKTDEDVDECKDAIFRLS